MFRLEVFIQPVAYKLIDIDTTNMVLSSRNWRNKEMKANGSENELYLFFKKVRYWAGIELTT